MKRAATGWPTKGLKTRVHPARGYVRDKHGFLLVASMANWQQRRRKANFEACLTGYAAKGRRITGKRRGNHCAIHCPAALVAAAYGDR